jgi:hypothetical protein
MPLMLKQWLERIDAAIHRNERNDVLKRVAGEKIEKCPGCQQWKVEGKVMDEHLLKAHGAVVLKRIKSRAQELSQE